MGEGFLLKKGVPLAVAYLLFGLLTNPQVISRIRGYWSDDQARPVDYSSRLFGGCGKAALGHDRSSHRAGHSLQ